MDERIKIIEHKDQEIMYVDYRGFKTQDELVALIDKVALELENRSNKIHVITNFEGVKVGSEYMTRAKELGNTVFAEKMNKSALLGITGLKKILLKSYNMFSKNQQHPFDTLEEAKDFVVS